MVLIKLQVTATEVLQGCDIGVKDGAIVCIGKNLPSSPNTKVIDCEGAYVTPGGVDSHVHLAQKNAPTGDGWETGSRSAIAGGTTTILAFASQQQGDTSLYPVLEVGMGGLTQPSAVMLDHVRGVDAGRVVRPLGRLSAGEYAPIRSGLERMFGLESEPYSAENNSDEGRA